MIAGFTVVLVEGPAMVYERPSGPGAEPGPVPLPERLGGADGGATPAIRLQILATEHWSLLASRSLAWNESFSRAGMFLTTLSGAIIALALVAQGTAFGEEFRLFALVVLPVVLIVGVGTLLRLGMSNYHESRCLIGMNRIRAAYLEVAPELEPYFVMGTTDDQRGMFLTAAIPPGTSTAVRLLSATPLVVMAINGLIVAAIVGLGVIEAGGDTTPALALGALGFVAWLAAYSWYVGQRISSGRREFSIQSDREAPAREPGI